MFMVLDTAGEAMSNESLVSSAQGSPPNPWRRFAVASLLYTLLTSALMAFVLSVSNPTPIEQGFAYASATGAIIVATIFVVVACSKRGCDR